MSRLAVAWAVVAAGGMAGSVVTGCSFGGTLDGTYCDGGSCPVPDPDSGTPAADALADAAPAAADASFDATPAQVPPWWDVEYPWRRRIAIENPSDDDMDDGYQVGLLLDFQTVSSLGATLPTEGLRI